MNKQVNDNFKHITESINDMTKVLGIMAKRLLQLERDFDEYKEQQSKMQLPMGSDTIN